MPKVACDRAETKPKVKKTAALTNFSAALQHLWNCSSLEKAPLSKALKPYAQRIAEFIPPPLPLLHPNHDQRSKTCKPRITVRRIFRPHPSDG
jgi:hypothetical protein